MSPSWNIEALRKHIDALGTDRELHGAVDAIDRYVWIFRYHLRTARDAMKGIVHDDDPHGIKNMQLVFGSDDRQDAYNQAKLISEAHLLSCLHCARAMFDIFSHLVNGLMMEKVIPVRYCTLKKVAKRLPVCPLKSELQSLLENKWFKYVDGFLNTAKHRGLVQHSFHVSFIDASAGIRLAGFEYEGITHPQYSADELLRGVLEVKNKIVDCGMLLNDAVIASAVTL